MFEMKTWEEATKFKKSEIARIILYILNAILDIVTGIIGENIAWIVCGILWIAITIIEGCYLKIQKGNEEIINVQEKHTELQAIIIDALFNETAVEVDISKIKIPKIFSKPNPKKMQKKIEYYRKNHKFESQIVIDTDYTLLDGYTSYLIAKNYNKGSVIVKLKRKKKQYCENCGVELTKSNKYMEGMCMECKCGIDYEEK